MKPVYFLGCFLLATTCGLLAGSCNAPRTTLTPIHAGRTYFNLIIMYDGAIGNKPLLKAVKAYKANIIYTYKNFNGMAISVSSRHGEADAIRYFKQVKGVLSVERDRQLELMD